MGPIQCSFGWQEVSEENQAGNWETVCLQREFWPGVDGEALPRKSLPWQVLGEERASQTHQASVGTCPSFPPPTPALRVRRAALGRRVGPIPGVEVEAA